MHGSGSSVDYNKQVEPRFGNPIAFGVLSARSSGSPTQYLSAWVTRSQSALAALVTKLAPALKSRGTHDGATPRDDHGTIAELISIAARRRIVAGRGRKRPDRDGARNLTPSIQFIESATQATDPAVQQFQPTRGQAQASRGLRPQHVRRDAHGNA